MGGAITSGVGVWNAKLPNNNGLAHSGRTTRATAPPTGALLARKGRALLNNNYVYDSLPDISTRFYPVLCKSLFC